MRYVILASTFSLIAGLALAAGQSNAPKPSGTVGATAVQAKIKQATSAAPPDIAKDAGVMDWAATPNGPMKELRKGTNGWTCMPSTPEQATTPAAQDPMC